jgi:predicted extracellular nuclease
MAGRVSVATFNVRNLVTAGVTYYGTSRYSPAQFRNKVAWLAEQLYRMDADVVGLQEVFHAEALQAVVDAYHALLAARAAPDVAARKRYDHVHHVANITTRPDDPMPGLGLLSRRPLVGDVVARQDLSAAPITVNAAEGMTYRLDRLSRPLMVARVRLTDAVTATIVNAHLKSKRPEFLAPDAPEANPDAALFVERAMGSFRSLLRRSGEALALRRLVVDMMRGTTEPVIVLGDLNDEANAVTTGIVHGEAPARGWSVAVKRLFWDVELYSAARVHMRRSERDTVFTHIFNGEYGTLDHIFVSQEFYFRNPARLGDVAYVQCFNDHVTDSSLPGAPGLGDASDHGQLVAVLSIT